MNQLRLLFTGLIFLLSNFSFSQSELGTKVPQEKTQSLNDSTEIVKIEMFAIPFATKFRKGVTIEDISKRSKLYVNIKSLEEFHYRYGEEIRDVINESESRKMKSLITGLRLLLVITQKNGVKHSVYFCNSNITIYNGEVFDTNPKLINNLLIYLPESFQPNE